MRRKIKKSRGLNTPAERDFGVSKGISNAFDMTVGRMKRGLDTPAERDKAKKLRSRRRK